MAQNGKELDTRKPLPLGERIRGHRSIDPDLQLACVVARENGDSIATIGETFGLEPSQVRRIVRETKDTDLQAIRRVLTAEQYSLNAMTLRKAYLALLSGERDFNRVAEKGAPKLQVSESVLARMIADLSLTAKQSLEQSAGMADPDQKNAGSGNPMVSWRETAEEASRLLQALPAGSKMRVSVNQEVEVVSGEDEDSDSAPGVRSPFGGGAVQSNFSIEPNDS